MTSHFFSFFNDRLRRAQNDASRSRERAVRAEALLKPRRLATEALEDRRLLSASAEYVDAMNSYLGFGGEYTAENFNAIEIDGENLTVETLQAAIAQAAATPENDAIFIVGGGTIAFDPEVDSAFVVDFDLETQGELAIVGYQGTFQIDAKGVDRAFAVKSGALLLGSVQIVDGNADFGGAIAIGEEGEVVLDSVVLSANQASERGGAIANNGSLKIQNSFVVDNIAVKDGAAIYDGPFEFAPTFDDENAPEFVEKIADVEAENGATVQIDLSKYFSDGDWVYSFECSDPNAAAFAEAPTLDGAVLTLKFIGNDDYDSSLDLSSVRFAVSAASPNDSTAVATSNEFDVALANNETIVMQAVLSTLSAREAAERYAVYAADDEDQEYPLGYGAESIPDTEDVDFSSSVYLQLWANDVASNWGLDVDCLANLGCVVRVYNGELANPSSAFGQMSALLLSESAGDGCVDYNISVLYNPATPSAFGVDSGILFTAMKVTRLDASLPVVVELLPSSDVREPVAGRLVAGADEAVPVDGSQIAFVGVVVDGGGEAISSAATATATQPTTIVSNVVFSGNVSESGAGVLYAAENRVFDVRHATVVDNFVEGAALYAVGGDAEGSGSVLANSIVVKNYDANRVALVATQNAANYCNLADGFESETATQNGNVEYDASKPLFADALSADYRLVADSQAIGIASADQAFDVASKPLTTDVLGLSRDDAPDVGAFEYGVDAPVEKLAAPSNVALSNYKYLQHAASGQWFWTTRLTWTDNSDAETKYVVAARVVGSDSWSEYELAANKTALTLGVDPNKDYVLRVWGENENGASDFVEFTFYAAQDVLTGIVFSSDAPQVGESLVASVEPTTGVATYQWYRVDATGTETAIDGATESIYVPTEADVDCYLKVVATGTNPAYASNVSAQTSQVVVQTDEPLVAPTAPSGLVFGEYDPETQTLPTRWVDNSNNETSFVFQCKIGDGDWTDAETLSADATEFVATGVRSDVAYEFRVKAVNEAGESFGDAVSFSAAQDVLSGIVFSTDAPQVGESLVASVEPTTGVATYQWYRVDATGTETAIDGATESIYVPTEADADCYLKVVATGTNPAYASNVSAQTAQVVVLVPNETLAAPSDVRFAGYDPGAETLHMFWTDNSDNETGFEVEYREDGASEWLPAAKLDANVASRVATAVSADCGYEFRIRAVNLSVDALGNEQTLYSEWTSASFSVACDVVSAVEFSTVAPTVGEAVVASVANGVAATFQWFRVANGVRTPIVGATEATYVPTDSDVGCALAVVARSANSAYSGRATAQTLAVVGTETTRPDAPTNVTFAEYDPETQTVQMFWTNASTTATQVVVEYQVDEGDWRVAAIFNANESGQIASERVATQIAPNADYSFRLKAVDANGVESIYTNATFNASRDVLESVRLDSAPAVGAPVQAVLGDAANRAAFQWYRVDADGNAAAIVGATDAVYIPTASDVGNRLQVVAIGANAAYFSQVVSDVSAIVATESTIPNAPSNVVFGEYDAETKRVFMSWTDESNNEKGFVVEYSLDGGTTWSLSEELGVDATGREAWGLRDGARYTFRVAAFNDAGHSDWTIAQFQVPAPISTAAKTAAFATFDEDAEEDDENDPFGDVFDFF